VGSLRIEGHALKADVRKNISGTAAEWTLVCDPVSKRKLGRGRGGKKKCRNMENRFEKFELNFFSFLRRFAKKRVGSYCRT